MKTITRILFSILLSSLNLSAHALENQLRNHPSPYLAMHGSDPVHWQNWGKQAIEAAKNNNKLPLLSR